jgi:integrase
MDVQTAIARFLAWCRAHHSPGTSLVYSSRLKGLTAMILEDGAKLGERELGAVTREQVGAWHAAASKWPDGRSKAPDTVRAYAIAFKAFQAWALEFGHLRAPIAAKLKKPMGRWRERIPTKEETAKLLEQASPEFRRIYRGLQKSGARPGELARATIGDWHRPEHAIVLEKHKTAKSTGRVRQIPVGEGLAAILLAAIGDRTDPTAPIFLSPSGRPWTPNYLSKSYKKLRDRAGLSKQLVLYLARHEHGTAMCKKFGIKAAADALGHISTATTQRYVHTTNEERARNQDSLE